MRKKTLLTAAFISVLLSSTVAGVLLVNLGRANPNPFGIPEIVVTKGVPDSETKPPTVSIASPTNDTAYSSSSLSLTWNVSVGDSSTASNLRITEITIEADWLQNKMTIGIDGKGYKLTGIPEGTRLSYDTYVLKLTGVPEGTHSLVIQAEEEGEYVRTSGSGFDTIMYVTKFFIDGSSSIVFAVDLKPPIVSVLSVENKTYTSADIPLNFTLNEQVSRITYCLDEKDNVTATGNTTLTGLPVGVHNVTVYGWDAAGNVGASETITFTIAESEPFPTTMVIAPTASVAFVGASLLVYFKKRKR